MSLVNYSDLKTSVGAWLNRSDLTTVIPDFITLFEAEANRRLRVQEQVVRADATVDAQYVSLPGDFNEMQSFYLKTSPARRLEFITVEELVKKKSEGYSTSGKPRYFSIVGSTAEFLPAPSESFTAELVYFAKVAALSDTNTTNWLLTNHPDIYLYGSLMQSAPYLLDDDRLQVWSSMLEKFMTQIETSSEKKLFSSGVLKARVRRL